MNTKTILNDTIKRIKSIPASLSGDDSPLADPWEEIKEQVQNEASFFWKAYLDTMNGIIEGTLDSLSIEERTTVATELKMTPDDLDGLQEAIMEALIARAENETIEYTSFDFDYFRYSINGMSVYAEVLERMGVSTCKVKAYSVAAPWGEEGNVDADIMEDILSRDEFESARDRNWSDKVKKELNTQVGKLEPNIYDEVAKEADVPIDQVFAVTDTLLKELHKRLVEYPGDYLGEKAHWELSEKGFYHLLGVVEQLSRRYNWEKGTISEYLGRLPPIERWKGLAKEIRDWDWQTKS